MVAPSTTLHLVIDPASPLAMPDIKFLGAEQRVAPLKKSLIENLESWTEDEPLLTNLERLLDITLPARSIRLEAMVVDFNDLTLLSRDDEGSEDWGVECGICYSFLLGDQLPTITCEDSRCCKPFHPTCLYEYFQVEK